VFGTIKNIVSALSILPALLALIPKITELVHQVEQPGVPGATKKASALSLLRACLDLAVSEFGIKVSVDTVMRWADGIIDVIVAVENALDKLLPHAAAAEGGG
jgi:hypothetical protein